MDKRDLAQSFRSRLQELLQSYPHGKAQFMREAGLDRSALSQFLTPESDRLPRAETLRRIAVTSGVSIDWLLCLENAPEGRQEVAERVQIEKARQKDGSTPLDQWRISTGWFDPRFSARTRRI